MINWYEEFTDLYQAVNPARADTVNELLKDFAGYEESLWLALTKKYNVPDLRPSLKPPEEAGNLGTARQRVIRMYAHYAPAKLADIDSTVALMREDGPGRVFGLLIKKYGEEPPVKPASYHERILVLYATYGALDRVNALPALLATYDGMEDVLLRRLSSELGPEPHTLEAGDPRDPKERLRRIFALHHPDSIRRIDNFLSRYKGNEIQLFAMLQRQYGREPSEHDLAQAKERLERERARQKAEQQAAEREAMQAKDRVRAERELDVSKKMLQLGATMWDAGALMPLERLPGDAQRPEPFYKMRDHLGRADHLSYDTAYNITADLFRSYERSMVPYIDDLLGPRYDGSETGEFFALLDCCYANAVPSHLRANLRTVVSLLEMKHGSTLEEIWVAGGVEKFLDKIDPASRDEWAVYLTMLHGSVTEAELAARNRLRAYYLHYNPGTPLPEVDGLLRGLGGDTSGIYGALQSHYGPEPEPLAVDMHRVNRILAKHDPNKLNNVDEVVEAHTFVGDDAETVIQRIERSYGPMPTEGDEVLARLESTELTDRFEIFSNELRLRLVIGRKRAALEHPDLDVLSSIIKGTPQYHDEATRKLQEAAEEEAREGPFAALAQDEEDSRYKLVDFERSALKSIVDMFGGILDVSADDANPELGEMITRRLICDDEVVIRLGYAKQLRDEARELDQWLQGRLIWRAKWKRDEEIAQQKKADAELRERLLKEAESAPSAPVLYTEEHLQDMMRLRDEVNEQATEVLRFNAQVHTARHGPRDAKWQSEVTQLLRGTPYHRGCVFHKPEYATKERPRDDPISVARRRLGYDGGEDSAGRGFGGDDDDEDVDAMDTLAMGGQDWEAVFLHQCHDYIRSLIQAYEPLRLPLIGELLREHFGREHQLVGALEQQYNVGNWRSRNLLTRVEDYYNRVAPANAAREVPELMRRFGERPELLWAYLKSRYGRDPEVRSPQVRAFLVNRLRRYLARVAPERLPEAELLVDRCEDHNCDTLFAGLTAEHGPEDVDIEFESIRLKLMNFYRSRRLTHVNMHVRSIAKRFVGRQELLQEIIRRKFGATLDDVNINPEDLAQH